MFPIQPLSLAAGQNLGGPDITKVKMRPGQRTDEGPKATSGTLLGSGVLHAKRRVFPVSGRTERSLGSTVGELQADTGG